MIKINDAMDKLLKGKNAKYLVFLCIGIIMLIAAAPLSGGEKSAKSFDSYHEKKLAGILRQIDGIGDVDVMITSKNNEVEGVIIVAQGAERPDVKSNIYNAAVAALGVKPHKIEIFTKKGGEGK